MTPIQDHGIIGDSRSAALISKTGTVDWLCWPKFDSPSLFASLLDSNQGGAWTLTPVQPFTSRQEYIEATNILVTHFSSEQGTVTLTDWMPSLSEKEKANSLLPECLMIRKVACTSGRIPMQMTFSPRPDYGRAKFRIRKRTGHGYTVDTISSGQNGAFLLGCQEEQATLENNTLSLHFQIAAGEFRYFSLTYDSEAPGVLPPSDIRLEELLQLTAKWWRDWSARLHYAAGPWKKEVLRSALALKLLQYAPSGAIVAAPTTSLPEKIGGSLNWDYRYCWLRDAAFTVRAFLGLGYREEGEAFNGWVLNATWTTRPRVRVLYDLYGEADSPESELSHWEGYRGSRPVRIGNEAGDQLQLDTYGVVMDAVIHVVHATHGSNVKETLDRDTLEMLVHLGEFVCRHWQEPDNGIWEVREKKERFTHSLVLCWVALDRLLKMWERGILKKIPVELFQQNRDWIAKDIRENGWNAELQSYTQTLGGKELDASLLLLSWFGFEEESSPRMQSTCAALRKKLEPKPGLLYRYEASLENGEGAFGICGFWMAEFLARGGGSLEEARQAFSAGVGYGNELGLFAEEVDPATGDALGNFPQAFTHVGLINAALSLAEREKREEEETKPVQHGVVDG